MGGPGRSGGGVRVCGTGARPLAGRCSCGISAGRARPTRESHHAHPRGGSGGSAADGRASHYPFLDAPRPRPPHGRQRAEVQCGGTTQSSKARHRYTASCSARSDRKCYEHLYKGRTGAPIAKGEDARQFLRAARPRLLSGPADAPGGHAAGIGWKGGTRTGRGTGEIDLVRPLGEREGR